MSLVPHPARPRISAALQDALLGLGLLSEEDQFFDEYEPGLVWADDRFVELHTAAEAAGPDEAGLLKEADVDGGDVGEPDVESSADDAAVGDASADMDDDAQWEDMSGVDISAAVDFATQEGTDTPVVRGAATSVPSLRNYWSSEIPQDFWPRPLFIDPPESLRHFYDRDWTDEELADWMRELEHFREKIEPRLLEAAPSGSVLDRSLRQATWGMSNVLRAGYFIELGESLSQPQVQARQRAGEHEDAFSSVKGRVLFGPNNEAPLDWTRLDSDAMQYMDLAFGQMGVSPNDEVAKQRFVRLLCEKGGAEETEERDKLRNEAWEAMDEMKAFLLLHPEYESFLGDKPLPPGRTKRMTGNDWELPLSGVGTVLEEARERVARTLGFFGEKRDIEWDGRGRVYAPLQRVDGQNGQGVQASPLSLIVLSRLMEQATKIPVDDYNGKLYRIFASDATLPLGFFQSHHRPDPETMFTTLMPLVNGEMSGVVWITPFCKITVLWRILLQLTEFFTRGGLFWLHTGVNELHGGGLEKFAQLQASVQELGGRLEVTLGSNPESAATNHAKCVVMQVARTGAIVLGGMSANISESGLGANLAAHQYPRLWDTNVSNEALALSYSLFTSMDGMEVGLAWDFLRDLSRTLANEWREGRVFLPLKSMFQHVPYRGYSAILSAANKLVKPEDKTQSTTDRTGVAISHAILIARLQARLNEDSVGARRSALIIEGLRARAAELAPDQKADQLVRSVYLAKVLGMSIPKPKVEMARGGRSAAKEEARTFEEILRADPVFSEALDEMKTRQQGDKAFPRQGDLRAETHAIRRAVEKAEYELATADQKAPYAATTSAGVRSRPRSQRPTTGAYSAMAIPQLRLLAEAGDAMAVASLTTKQGSKENRAMLKEKAAAGDVQARERLARQNRSAADQQVKRQKTTEGKQARKQYLDGYFRGKRAAAAADKEFKIGTPEYWTRQKRLAADGDNDAIDVVNKGREAYEKLAAEQGAKPGIKALRLRQKFGEDVTELLEGIVGSAEWKVALERRADAGDATALKRLEGLTGTKYWLQALERRETAGDTAATAERERHTATRQKNDVNRDYRDRKKASQKATTEKEEAMIKRLMDADPVGNSDNEIS